MDTVFPNADLLRLPPFTEAERQLARGLAEVSPDAARDPAPFAAAWLLQRVRQGASRTDLDNPPAWPGWPSRVEWEKLAAGDNPLVGGPKDYRPVIVENGGLYLHRFHRMEARLADGIAGMTETAEPGPAALALLDTLFARNAGAEPDLQKRAVLGALKRRFAVITGGPGTGKTTCVLALLLVLLAENTELSIALAAPTGKAAARLNESLAKGVAALRKEMPAGLDPALLEKIPVDARTLHRLLGVSPDASDDRARADGPLASADVVVADEASMIALPMMARLVESLAPGARLILLGDRDQLASVELGSVLGDIVAAAEPPGSALHDAAHRLTKTYRFKENEVIGKFCLAIRDHRPAEAVAALKNAGSLQPAPGPENVVATVGGYVREYFSKLGEPGIAPEDALRRLDGFRLLCSHRIGPCGVVEINRLAHRALGHRPGDIFPGLPVLVTVNTPDLDLWNGDCGVIVRDTASGELRAVFSGTGEPRFVSPAKLPDWEPAFAMTIHKAQGSEFDAVAMLLPAEDSPLLTRELVYTGASRAKSRLVVHAGETLLATALSKSVARPSGLAARLQGRARVTDTALS